MRIYNDFIGSDDSNTTLKFIGGDSKKQFIKSTKEMPKDWYYNNTEILYEYNNLGHRCKNFEDLDQTNYILFIGCSHTMGVGLELEKTYPYLLSEKLKMDYYNLAVPATGNDVLEYNLLTWFFKVNKKPKLVVIQWPDQSRFMEYDELRNHALECGTWSTDPNYMSFVVNAEDTGMFSARVAMVENIIKNIIEIPMITFNFGNQRGYGIYDLHMSRIDRARDLGHAGIESHKQFTKILFNHIEVNRLVRQDKYDI
jgi:hypothetical protein